MQTTSCCQLSMYTSMDLNQIPLANSIDDLHSPMHLFLHAMVRCQTVLELPQSTLFQHEYPTWKRFIDEIEQYADWETRVTTSSQPFRSSTYGYVLMSLSPISKIF